MVTIAVVVACGIAAYVSLGASYRSMVYSQEAYYDHYRFADVFSRLKRAPSSLEPSLQAIPGVAQVYTRLVESVMLQMPDMAEPAFGEIVSLPPDGQPPLNGVRLVAGRSVEPGREDETVLLQAFADAHKLRPGDTLKAVVNGRLRVLRIVGLAMSPEYVFGAAPGDVFGDPRRFAVLWMNRSVIAPAFRMEGAFDSVVLVLQPGASNPAVRDQLDRLLAPYGGAGSVDRDHQLSHHMVDMKLKGIEAMATKVPILFLGIAAFLLNVVLSRLVQLQRSQIAALKALGYRDREIGLHYLQLVSAVVVLGALLGLLLGAWGASGMLVAMAPYFHFPSLTLKIDLDLVVISVFVSLLSALVGGLATVRNIARMAPAEAMRPPAPPEYRLSLAERLGLGALLGVSGLMVMREFSRRPVRLALSSLGIALSVGILVAGRANLDAIHHFVNIHFYGAQRQDATVSFVQPIPARALRSLGHIDGVTDIEGARVVPVRYRAGARHRDSTLTGHTPGERLQRLLDREGRIVPLPPGGVVLDAMLAEILRIKPGDEVEVEALEGAHPTRRFTVLGVMDGSLGLTGHMRDAEVASFLGEERLFSVGFLAIDPARAKGVYAALQQHPRIVGVARKEATLEEFKNVTGNSIVMMVVILTLFASAITIGVVYNNARVALSQRERELGSLRVLGYTRAEVSSVLLGEMAAQVLLALPVGLWLGRLMAIGLASTRDAESFRFPIVIAPQTYAFAVLVVLLTSATCALIVRRHVDRLDLIAVLKTRE